MARRIVSGDVYGDASMFGMRVSAPTYDAVTEAVNSDKIPFDTRYSQIGSAVASGLIQCDGAAIPFKTLPYAPIALIYPWDGTDLQLYNMRSWSGVGTTHLWFPAVAIVTPSQISVTSFVLPWYNTKAFYDPTGTYFAFSVFATG